MSVRIVRGVLIKLLYYAIKFANTNGFISNEVSSVLRKSKESILDAISNKIENNFTNQIQSHIKKYCLTSSYPIHFYLP